MTDDNPPLDLILDDEQQKKALKWNMRGFDAEEITYMIQEKLDVPIRERTVEKFLNTEEAEKRIRLMKQIQDKKAEVTKEDLVRDLKSLKEIMEQKVSELKDTEHGVTMNESAKNIIRAVEKIGQLIGEIGVNTTAENLIRVDKLQVYIKNNTEVLINQMEEQDQRRLVRDLSDELGIKILEEKEKSKKEEKKVEE